MPVLASGVRSQPDREVQRQRADAPKAVLATAHLSTARLSPGPARKGLPLPGDEICTQLIRDPLRKEAPAARAGRPSTNFVFVAGGSRLLYGTPDGLVTHLIPGAPGFASDPVDWALEKDEEVVAAGWDKGLLAGCLDGRRSLAEPPEAVVAVVRRAVERTGAPTLFVSSNSDLELLPRDLARAKVARLGEVRDRLRKELS